MKKLLLIFGLLIIAASSYPQGTPPARSARDSVSIDTDGNGVLDTWLYVSPGVIAHLKKGANITFTVSATGDTLTIAGEAGSSGTSDSLGVDTNSDGVVDAVLYSTGGLFAYALKPGSGITMTVNTDTVYIASTLGTDISSSEIVNQTIDKTDIDSTASNVVFDNAYEGTSAQADSQYATRRFTKLEMADSLAEYILLNGARTMTANWSYGDFDLTGAEKVVADTGQFKVADIDDIDLYTGANSGGAYDSTDIPTNNQQLTWVTGGILRWENQGSGGGGNVFKLGVDPSDGSGAASLIDNDTVYIQGTSTVRVTLNNTIGPADTVDLSVGDASLLDVKMANNALDADKIVGDATDDDDLDVAAGGTGVSTLTDGGLLIGGGSADITALGVAINGQIPIGDGTTAPVLGTISGTANEIDVTNGAGSITIGIVNPLGTAQGGTGVTDPAIWRTKNTSDTVVYVGGDTLLVINRENQTVDTVVIRPGGTHFLEVEADRLEISGDIIDDFQGTGLTLSGTALATTLGTSVDLASAEVTGTLPVENGGTETTTLTDGGIMLGSGTGAVTVLGVAINGQIPIGDGVTDPVLATITQGVGITVTNGAGSITIDATLGTDISGAEILDQTIAKSDVDTTGSNFIFDNAYEGTSAEPDSQYSTKNFVKKEILDSLAEYVLMSGTRALTGNWGAGDFDITGLEALELDTLRNSGDTVVVEDPLKLRDITLYTGGNNFAQYDTADAPSNGQQLTWNTGNSLTWEAAGGAGGGDDARADTNGADAVVNLASPFFLEQSTGIDLSVSAALDTIYLKTTLGTDITSAEIVDQTIVKADIDTTASNFPFDDAYHVTSNVADSEYASFRYAQARAGDTAAAIRNGDTWTGTHVYSSAVITLPNGVNPTTATEGDISWDTDDDALEVTDGTNDVLIPFQRTISFAVWDPELLTDTVSIFYCDSTIYQGGVTLTSFEAQTNVDGAYTLKLFEFNANDPPDTTGVGVGSGTLASLAFGATDQRDQSTTFAGSGTIARGNSVAILTPATNINWLRVSITFRVNENN